MAVSPKEVAAVRDVARLGTALPYMTDQLDRMERGLDTKTLVALAHGELSPEKALEAWIEKSIISRMRKGLTTAIRVGTTIGERVADDMQMEGKDG